MTTKRIAPLGEEFLKFWTSQGVTFVDMETGKPINSKGDEDGSVG